MAEVVFENVTKIYDNGVEAVKNVNLTVKDKEFLVLVGPSGCGKSTTLRMVAGLEDITYGKIYIGNRLVNNVEPKARDIAMVFQNYALYPHMSVYDNMAFGLKLRKYPKDEIRRRVLSAAKMLGIEDLLNSKPKALSGGQRQRVAVGRAIVRDPAAFLFDEPLSNLDAKLRVETRSELKALHHRLGTTTIYVTHDQEEAFALADRVILLNGGKVVQSGRPEDVYRHPVSTWAARFLGQSNLLAAEVIAPHLVATSIGQLVVGKAVPLPPIGTKGTLLIHDEGIHLTGDESNSFTAKVLSRSYHGYAYRINALLPGGKLNFMRTRGMTVPRVGETLSIHISPNALHWIPE